MLKSIMTIHMFIQSDASHDPNHVIVEQYYEMYAWLTIVYLLIKTEDI